MARWRKALASAPRAQDEFLATLTRVQAEPGRLHQVLGNLLSNAIKCTPAGGAVDIGLREEEGRFVVSVRDAGAVRRHGGLGPGLSVMHQLVEMPLIRGNSASLTRWRS